MPCRTVTLEVAGAGGGGACADLVVDDGCETAEGMVRTGAAFRATGGGGGSDGAAAAAAVIAPAAPFPKVTSKPLALRSMVGAEGDESSNTTRETALGAGLNWATRTRCTGPLST